VTYIPKSDTVREPQSCEMGKKTAVNAPSLSLFVHLSKLWGILVIFNIDGVLFLNFAGPYLPFLNGLRRLLFGTNFLWFLIFRIFSSQIRGIFSWFGYLVLSNRQHNIVFS